MARFTGGALVIALAVYVVGCALFTAWFCRVCAITERMEARYLAEVGE